MGVMQDRRVQRSEFPQPRTPERGALPRAAEEPSDTHLWRVFQELDFGEHVRIEFIAGTIVVSGTPSNWHERVVSWLGTRLTDCCETQGWDRFTNSGLPGLPPPAIAIRPDLMVISDPGSLSEEEIPFSQVLLVAEVVSKGSKKADRVHKPLSCARAGIPLYLYVDRFARAVTVSLLSAPGPDGYEHRDAVTGGPCGGKLTIPEPFGLTLDLTTLPMRRGDA